MIRLLRVREWHAGVVLGGVFAALWWAGALRRPDRSDDSPSSQAPAVERTRAASVVTSAVTGKTLVASEPPAETSPVARVAAPIVASPVPVRIEGGGSVGSVSSTGGAKPNPSASPAAAVAAMHRKLDRDRIEWAYAELSRPSRENVLMSPAQDASYKNDLLDKLILQEKLPVDLTRRLVEWHRDRNHDALFRDYCLQFLGSVGERLLREGAKDSDDLRLVNSTLGAALNSTESSFPGTALLGLERMAMAADDAALLREVGNRAVLMAGSDSAPTISRATALQVACHLNRSDVLPTARRLVANTTDSGVRLSALATLRHFNQPTDAATLRQYAQSANPYEASAARP